MKSYKHFIINFAAALAFIPAALLTGCTDELVAPPDYTVAGKETLLKLTVSAPEMNTASRAALTDEQKNKVFNVWVRTFSSTTHNATSEWEKIENLSLNELHGDHTINNFQTKSGPSFIVAVANIDNPAHKMNADGTLGSASTLRELLEDVNTWEDFNAIVVDAPNEYVPDNINQNGLPMTGCYIEDSKHGVLRTWGQQNFTSVFIPYSSEATALGGKIHLRRIASHIIFNLIPGDNAIITPESYRIVNKPLYSYAYERDENTTDDPNYGDRVTESKVGDFYSNSDFYDHRYFGNGTQPGAYTFDFWLAENKQQSTVEACNDYHSRELEHKTPVTANQDGSGPTEANSGIYVNLTGSTTWTPKNMATFVEIQCLVQRKNNVPFEPVEGATNAGSYGNAVFTVHLGFCEGDTDAEKAKDFNCRRNTEYTYNITIKDINNIYVEAKREGESQPGMEGTVNDVEMPIIEVDAHYATVPITLSQSELEDDFGFTIEARDFNGNLVSFNEKSTAQEMESMFASWVEIAPTPKGQDFATYNPATVYNLKEFKDAIENKTFTYSSDGRYTLFINEYTYETSVDESGGNWKYYVNRPNRRVWVRTRLHVSTDGQSSYMRSKYAVSQRAIQTYYDENGTETTALGVEHLNESYGLTLAQSFYNAHGDNQTADIPTDNARYQTWYWLNSTSYPYTGTLADYSKSTTALRKWLDVVDFSKRQDGTLAKGETSNSGTREQYFIPKIAVFNTHGNTTNQSATSGPRHQLSSSTEGILPWDWNTTNRYSSETYLPNTNRDYWIEGINACINRNRDNNGDGVIDASELRWFVPDLGKYIRMIIGRKSLISPLMPYDEITKMPNVTAGVDVNFGQNPQYLLYATGRRYLFANEGLSTQVYGRSGARPWQVRCVRNLGTNLASVPSSNEQAGTPAYTINGRIVRMTHYDPTSIRTNKYTGALPTHYIYQASADYNMLYKAFEIAPLNSETTLVAGTNGRTQFTDAILAGTTNPCSTLTGTGWRLPNQKELTIMMLAGVFNNIANGAIVGTNTRLYYNNAGNGLATDATGTRRIVCATRTAANAPIVVTAQTADNWYYRCVRDVE